MIKTQILLRKTIEGNRSPVLGLELGLDFFYFILKLPPLISDVTCSVTLLGRKKYEEATIR